MARFFRNAKKIFSGLFTRSEMEKAKLEKIAQQLESQLSQLQELKKFHEDFETSAFKEIADQFENAHTSIEETGQYYKENSKRILEEVESTITTETMEEITDEYSRKITDIIEKSLKIDLKDEKPMLTKD